jgi:hypothetical protein
LPQFLCDEVHLFPYTLSIRKDATKHSAAPQGRG